MGVMFFILPLCNIIPFIFLNNNNVGFGLKLQYGPFIASLGFLSPVQLFGPWPLDFYLWVGVNFQAHGPPRPLPIVSLLDSTHGPMVFHDPICVD